MALGAMGVVWAGQAHAQAQDHHPEVRVPPRTDIRLDGDLVEWRRGRHGRILIDRSSQVWQQQARGAWKGVDDLSAELFLAYDAAHLYLAGRVRDQSLVHGQNPALPNLSDVLEVFLDLRRPEGRQQAGARLLGPDQPQVFLIPMHPGRKWALVEWAQHPAILTKPGGEQLNGVRVVGRPAGQGAYTFEARLPFHNFFGPEEGSDFQQFGFNVALGDRDQGTERYQYMTWTGTNPTQDARNLGRLVLTGPPPLAVDTRSDLTIQDQVKRWLPYLAAAAVFLALVLLFLRRASAMTVRPFYQRLLRGAGILMLVAGLWVPSWWESSRASATQDRLAQAAHTLHEQLPKMESGTLGSYLGGQRDRPLLDLLSGRTIARRGFSSHLLLSDLVPGEFGSGPRRYPDEFFDVRPYWIPLPQNQPQRFTFKKPLGGGKLNVVVARRAVPAGERQPSFQLELKVRRDDDPEEADLSPDEKQFREITPADNFGGPGHEMSFVTVAIPSGVRGLGVKAVGDDDLALVGMTVVPEQPGQAMRPLDLGQPSISGVPSELRDRYPQDAGIELRNRGEKHEVVLPPDRRSFDRMWLFYRAISRGLGASAAKGQEVCRVTARFVDGRTQDISLHHQVSMMFERLDANEEKEPAADVPAKIAFRWRDENQEQRINLVYEQELAKGKELASLTFENLAPYPVRFRSVVFGNDEAGAPLDLEDSPVETRGSRAQLGKSYRQQFAGVDFGIYRNGDLVEDGASAGAEHLRSSISQTLQDSSEVVQLDEGDTRVFERYLQLTGEGWAGAVLGMQVRDTGFGDHRRWASLCGFVLCLLSTPLMLLLFSDALGWVSNLRLRLMLVVSVATLVPLGVLFVFLVGVLEGGHRNELRRNMRGALQTTQDQLQDRQAQLFKTAKTWATDLERDYQGMAGSDLDTVRDALANTLRNQLPPGWQGGFLRLEFQPEKTSKPAGLQPFSLFVGAEDLRDAAKLVRSEADVYLSWGVPLLGVRVEKGPLLLSVGRPVQAQFLEDISPGMMAAVLCDPKGYPLTCAGSTAVTTDVLASSATEPRVMADRVRAREAARETGQPEFQTHRVAGQDWLGIYEVIRDLSGTPRAILGLVDRNTQATLELGLGRVPVRDFCLLVAIILLVLALVLASVVTSRITHPIERLEEAAEALRHGQLDVRVQQQEGGQIGRLTRTFNQMAQDLRGRIHDLDHLNRGIQNLTSGLDLDQVVQSAIAIFSRHSPADRVRVLLLDRERDRVEVFGDSREELEPGAGDVAPLLQATGPCSMRLQRTEGGVLQERFEGFRSILAFPLVLAGQVRGSILLLFERRSPATVNLELLSTMSAQTAAAVENARLYRHAVEDLYTGAYIQDYFRRQVMQAVDEAHREGRQLLLLGLRLVDGDQLQESLGAEGYGRYLEQVVRVIRQQLPAALLCRAAPDAFEVLVPLAPGQPAGQVVPALLAAIEGAELGRTGPPRLAHAFVLFPGEAASAEFLFHALETRLVDAEVDAPGGDEPTPIEDGVVLSSPKMAEVVRVLRKVAPSELTILLEGETGTGKEVMCNLVHKWSKRAAGPLVKVHCAALTESLLQSELFGHEKGAFTGAVARKIGRFEQAQGGTLFLDEIGEISLDTQVKLLRVLQEKEIDRVGGLSPVRVDVRVVAATNKNIRAMVRAGTFREDLYYRLQGMVVTVPPLRERKTEIPALVEGFLREAVAAGHTAVRGFSTDAMDELFRRDWAGNIRELRNMVFRAMVLAARGLVQREHLMGTLTPGPGGEQEPAPVAGGHEPVVLVPRPDPASAPTLAGRLARLYQLVAERQSLATEDYVAAAGVSPRTALRDLQQLLRMGLIERVGKRRGARYRIADPATGERARSGDPTAGEFQPDAGQGS